MHNTRRLFLSAAMFALVSAGCAEVYAQGIAQKVARDIDKIDSYTGRVVERGVVDGADLVSEVIYQKPLRARIEVTAPAAHKGELFLYNGKRMVMWFPRALLGIEVTGFENPDKQQIYQHIKRLTREAMRVYAFSLRSEYRKVAGERAKEWRITPTRRHPYRIRHTSWTHAKYSMPLKLEMKDAAGKPWYAMEVDRIAYNQPIDPSAFDFEFPENAVVFRWNLAAPGITAEQAARKMNFSFRLPTYLPKGHKIGKIIQSPHCLPAVIVTMNRGASWLSLSEVRHVPGLFAPRGKKVAVGKATGYLSFLGTFSSVTWVVGDTQLTLTGNISFPELLDVAASVK